MMLDGETFHYCGACGQATSERVPCGCPLPPMTTCKKCGLEYRKGLTHSKDECRGFIEFSAMRAAARV